MSPPRFKLSAAAFLAAALLGTFAGCKEPNPASSGESLAGITADITTLLAQQEAEGESLQRITISFNADRYQPWARAKVLSRRPPAPPLRRSYHVDIKFATLRDRKGLLVSQLDLPVESRTSRIPVMVTGFFDPKRRFPMAKAEITSSDGISRVFWFDYVNGNWRPAGEAR